MNKNVLLIFVTTILLLVLLITPTISAEKITYSENDLKITLSDTIIFGLIKTGEVGTFELKSHKSIDEVLQTSFGNQIVMYYDFNFNENYINGLGDVKFKDMKTGKDIERDYRYVYFNNGEWKDYNSKDIPKGNIRIGILVEVRIGDYVDGIWEVGGKEISKHAVWEDILQRDLDAYYKLDETSGSVVGDFQNNYTGTNINNTEVGVTGILNTAYNFVNVDENFINTTYNPNLGANSNISISFWMNSTNTSHEGDILGMADGSSNFVLNQLTNDLLRFRLRDNAANVDATTTTDVIDGTWHNIVIIIDRGLDQSRIYVDGISEANTSITNSYAVDFTNYPLYLGVLNQGGEDNFPYGYNGLLDEIGIWSRVLNQTEITNIYNGGNAISPPDYPSITLNSPADSLITVSQSVIFNASITKDTDNVSILLDGIINNTNTSTLNGNYVFTISNIGYGTHNWSIFSCNSNGCATSSTRDLEVSKYIVNSYTYQSSSYETKQELFYMNITVNGTSITNGELIYNGTTYSATSTNIGGDDYNISSTIQIPLNQEIKDFFFNITIDGIESSSETNSQVVNNTILTICNTTYKTQFLNLTFRDEGNSTGINASIPTSSFVYYLGDGTVNKTYTYINNTENKEYYFCGSPNQTIKIVPSVQYKKEGYPQRIWSPDEEEISNSTTNQILYLLESTDGIYVTFQVINLANQQLEGVDAVVERTIGGNDVEVGHGTTDAAGSVTFWLNPDFTHTFTFSKEGLTNYETSFPPTQTSYTITMSSSLTNPTSYLKGIDYKITPLNVSLTNNTIYAFTFNLTSSFWDLQEYGFNLRLSNGTSIEGGSTSTSGTLLSLNFNTTDLTRIYMDYYWVINDTFTNRTMIWNVYSTDKTQWSISTFFKDFKLFLDSGFFGIDDFGRYLLVFIIIFLTIGIMSYKYGFTSPLVIISTTFLIILFFDVVVKIIPDINAFGIQIPHLLTIVAAIIMAIAWMGEFLK